MKTSSGVIWVTGYSASGKTTVGRKLEAKLRADGLKTVFLDGDDLRSIFGEKWGYQRENRIELAKVYFRLCSHLASQGLTVVIAAVAMYDEVRQWLKVNVPNSYEVFLDVPERYRIERDKKTKGIYSRIGDVSSLYDEPKNPDLTVPNYDLSPDDAAEKIKAYFYSGDANRVADRGKGQHWDSFYKAPAAPLDASPFAQTVVECLAPARKLLEVGCGNGRDAAYFGRLGHDVTALDTSASAVSFCKQQYADLPINFVEGSATSLLPDNRATFSDIYSRFCIHAMTFDEQDAFLGACRELLVPGGTLHIECRSINDPLARKGEVISPTERIHGHYRRFIVREDLEAQLVSYGFDILEAIESNGLAKFGDEDPVVIRVKVRNALT